MLPRQYRLKQRRDFTLIYKRGQSRVYADFVLYARKNHSGASRMGFSVSKKLGNAVRRNRVKRRFRAAAAQCSADFRPGVDYVVVVRRPALGVAFFALTARLKQAVRELNSQLDHKSPAIVRRPAVSPEKR